MSDNKYIIREYNCETGETIDREPTKDELEKIKIREAEFAEKIANEIKVKQEKAALLAKLGITEEEAKLLLS